MELHRFHHWRVRIQDAQNESALALVIGEYRSTLSPAMVEPLPAACKALLSAANLPDAALVLLQADMGCRGASPEVAALLHEIACTYGAAAIRMRELGGASGKARWGGQAT